MAGTDVGDRDGVTASWRLCTLLAELRREVNVSWPNRSRSSDGTIGDARHQAQDSDHNPNDRGVVRAWDITRDDRHGPYLASLAVWLVGFGQRGSDRMQRGSYIIYNRRIASYTHMWRWRAYSGSDPHTNHLHISAPLAPEFYDISRSWDLTRGSLGR